MKPAHAAHIQRPAAVARSVVGNIVAAEAQGSGMEAGRWWLCNLNPVIRQCHRKPQWRRQSCAARNRSVNVNPRPRIHRTNCPRLRSVTGNRQAKRQKRLVRRKVQAAGNISTGSENQPVEVVSGGRTQTASWWWKAKPGETRPRVAGADPPSAL